MTKKDYLKIAAVFKKQTSQPTINGYQHEALQWVASDLCGVFIEDNPKFDPTRFLTACGF